MNQTGPSTNHTKAEDQAPKADDHASVDSEDAGHHIENILRIQSFLDTKKPLPNFSDWAISADLGVLLISILRENDYDLVIEFGSGSSTLLIAKSMQERNPGSQTLRHIAVEHLQDYFDDTLRMLSDWGTLPTVSRVLKCDLAKWECTQCDREFQYYRCKEELSTLISEVQQFGRLKRILIFVDGPPGKICEMSRYPAIPIVTNLLPQASLDVLLDDYSRNDEKRVVLEWQRYLMKIGRECFTEFLPTRKGACLLRINA